MVLAQSSPMPIGASAPDFTLPDTRNNLNVSLGEFTGKPLVIVFMCNHCPYVVHLLDALTQTAHKLAASGIATVTISANDVAGYPQDAPPKMAELARTHGFEFPYCYDETQAVAKAYGAVCTPDLFLFDAQHQLYYQGQFDGTRPGQGQANGESLKQVAADLLAGKSAPEHTLPSVGCSIKWKH